MRAHGGSWLTRLACFAALAVMAPACSNSETPKRQADARAGDTAPSPVEGSAGGPATGGGQLAGGPVGGPVGGGPISGVVTTGNGLALSTGGGAATTTPGLTATGAGTGTAAADQASVVVLPAVSPSFEGLTTGSVSPRDRRSVLESLAGLHIAANDVSFEPDPRTRQPQVQVKVPVDQLGGRGPGIVQAVEKALGRARSSGATFSLANCEPATAPLRRQAVDQAQAQAKALADASRLTLGSVVAIVQDGASLQQDSSCPSLVRGELQTFDARPQVRLSVGVRVTYALSGAPAAPSARPLVWAEGSGTARTRADRAYVVVVFDSGDGSDTGGPTAADRSRLVDELGKLKIDRKDVQVTSRSDYGVSTVVQVATRAAGLDKSGKDIVRAVEDVFGRSDSNGVRFASTTCGALLATARRDAVADGRQRAGNLAAAAGVKLADLQSLSELSIGVDPCDDSIEALTALEDFSSSSSYLQPFDAEPEFTLTARTELAFAIG